MKRFPIIIISLSYFDNLSLCKFLCSLDTFYFSLSVQGARLDTGTWSEHLQLRLQPAPTERSGVRCGHQDLGTLHQGEQLQLPQEFAMHFPQAEQDLRLEARVLQQLAELAQRDAQHSEDLYI